MSLKCLGQFKILQHLLNLENDKDLVHVYFQQDDKC